MKKTIKSIATLVLACFISTSLVGSAWGEEPIKVDMKFYNYDEGKGELKDKIDTVYTDQTFAIAMQVYYGNELIENLQLTTPKGFELKKSYVAYDPDKKSWKNVFALKATNKAGDYKFSFIGKTKNGAEFSIDRNINIAEFPMVNRVAQVAFIVFIAGLIVYAVSGPSQHYYW